MKDSNKYKYILNYGGGVNSTALLILVANGICKDVDPKETLVLFADTGAERPDTYNYITLAQQYCKEKNISFEIVRAPYTLEEYVYHSGLLPSRTFRWCTHRLKIRPIRRRANMHDVAKPYYQLIGIDASESTRQRQHGLYKEAIERYPLLEMGLNRQDCISLIKDMNLAVPPKSSCFCCPFQRLSSFVLLASIYPQLGEKALRLEVAANKLRKDERAFYIFRQPIERVLARAPEIIERAKKRGELIDEVLEA